MGNSKNFGFTIVETLIVLTVSSVLAASAMLLISGRQNKTEFQVAINNLQQQIQQIVNQAASGYYPNNANFACTGNDLVTGAPKITTGTNEQGTNKGCIFLGNAFRLGRITNADFTVYPMVGNQLFGGKEVSGPTAFQKAHPIAIGTGTPGGHYADVPEDGTIYRLENGLTFDHALYDGTASASDIAAFAVVAKIDAYSYTSATSSALNSGSQQFGLYTFYNSPKPWAAVTSAQEAIDTINENDVNGLIARDSIGLCFASGTTNQSGLITIGGNSSLGVSLTIYGSTNCS